MPFFNESPHRQSPKPLEISIQVEVEVEEDRPEHHVASPRTAVRTGSHLLPPPPSAHSPLPHTMSLPRANYDPRRVCLNPFPEFTLGKHRRTVGVYLAGALVRSQTLVSSHTLFIRFSIVCIRPVDLFRCRSPLRARSCSLGR